MNMKMGSLLRFIIRDINLYLKVTQWCRLAEARF